MKTYKIIGYQTKYQREEAERLRGRRRAFLWCALAAAAVLVAGLLKMR